jgi:hypothetical protein
LNLYIPVPDYERFIDWLKHAGNFKKGETPAGAKK